jgi:hypothetical protein
LVAVTESKARVELKPMSSERVTLVQ